MQRWYKNRGGFALPTVLIASVVMLSILTVSVTSVAAVRNSLKVQYYNQLAKVAGEAGVAYAKACLAKNGNVPQWSDSSPLKPNTDCSGTPLSTISCPGSADCYVVSTTTYRSSFSVGKPTVDAQGKAITIPNSGFVELLRASTGQTWRTYYQPAVQAAVVPDLCSGEATTALGWSNAVASSSANKISLSGAAAATTISTAATTVPVGPMYFQRSFSVVSSGSYTVKVQTASSKDTAEIYVDGTKLVTSSGSLASSSITLNAGCHTISARLTNSGYLASYSQFAAAVIKAGATAPIVTTDTAWRAATGATVSFSSPGYYVDSSVWSTVTSYSKTHAKQQSSWAGTSNIDKFAAFITQKGNGCPGSCPAASYTYLRDSKDFYLGSSTTVNVAAVCDDMCSIYIDGTLIKRNNVWTNTYTQSVTLAAGYHHLGLILYNTGTATNPSGAAASVTNSTGTTVYARTDKSWLATSVWASGSAENNIYSYAADFTPNPDNFVDTPTLDALVVAGGGGGGNNGGGGGGGGGYKYLDDISLATGTYTVTVGAGGAKAASNSAAASNGSASIFGSYTTVGGGGGASRDGGNAAAVGGGGGGGAGATSSSRTPGASGTSGQGYAGGDGTTADAGASATGGGGGGTGNQGFNGASAAAAGDGGAGLIFYFGTTRYAVGGGGGGGVTVNGTIGYGTDGGANGALKGATASAATANTGGGGGGGGTGSNGGSGIVVISYKTSSMTTSATGTYSKTTSTINGVSYTFYKFTASGTFTISALNPS